MTEDIKNILYAIVTVLGLLVSYAAFWVLVVILVGFVIYQVISITREETRT